MKMSASNYEQGMVLVMGIPGSGKSYFVNRLKDGAVLEGDTMESCKPEAIFMLLEIRDADRLRHFRLPNCRDSNW